MIELGLTSETKPEPKKIKKEAEAPHFSAKKKINEVGRFPSSGPPINPSLVTTNTRAKERERERERERTVVCCLVSGWSGTKRNQLT